IAHATRTNRMPANDHLSHRKNTQLPPPPAAPLEHSLRARARSSHRERLERKSTLAMPIGLFGAHTVHVRRRRAAASPPLPNHCRFPSATDAPVAPTTAYREAESRPVTSTLPCSRMPHSAPSLLRPAPCAPPPVPLVPPLLLRATPPT